MKILMSISKLYKVCWNETIHTWFDMFIKKFGLWVSGIALYLHIYIVASWYASKRCTINWAMVANPFPSQFF